MRTQALVIALVVIGASEPAHLQHTIVEFIIQLARIAGAR
jgi:hypothetical protein